MPKILRARPVVGSDEERTVRRLAGARHAPADWVQRGRMITLSWDGLRVPAIAEQLGCHEQTVRRWLERFNADGLDGPADRGGQGRKRRITEDERSRILALVKQTPPGRPVRGPGRGRRRPPQPGATDPARRGSAVAAHPHLNPVHRLGFRGKRTRIVALYTAPPADATILCADELGPVIPRSFPPAPDWSPDGHRIKAAHELTMTTSCRNSVAYQRFLQVVEQDNPDGEIVVVTDNLSSHRSVSTRALLEEHPRIRQVFIPVGACWLNLQEGWWRIFRMAALAGQTFADPTEIEAATTPGHRTAQCPSPTWLWGRPAPSTRKLRRRFVYCL